VTGTSNLVRRCAICGATKDIEEHHLGQRNHAPYFTIPLCRPHHLGVTVALAQAGVDPRHTSDVEERGRLARLAALVFLWFLDEQLRPKYIDEL
jgi:hypothetical protein